MNVVVAVRYAEALFNCTPKGELESSLTALKSLQEGISQKPLSSHFFSAPQISNDKKMEVLKSVLEKKNHKNLLAFLSILLLKRRFKCLPDIITQFSHMVSKELNILDVVLGTPHPVSDVVKLKFKTMLEKQYHKKVRMTEQIDPSLIGGGTLFIAGRLIDFSLKEKLRKFKKELSDIGKRYAITT